MSKKAKCIAFILLPYNVVNTKYIDPMILFVQMVMFCVTRKVQNLTSENSYLPYELNNKKTSKLKRTSIRISIIIRTLVIFS